MMGLVAHAGSLTAAARRSGISKSVLSRAIAKLEAASEGPIFARSRSGLRLTAAGAALLPVAERAIAVARDAEDAMRTAAGTPQGQLRIAASSLATQRIVAPVLKTLCQTYPLIRPTVSVTSQGPDPVEAELDAVIRIGKVTATHVITRTLLSSPLALYGSAALADTTDVDDPVAVSRLGRLVIDVDTIPSDWTLTNAKGEVLTLADAPLLSVSDPINALDMLCDGFGMSFLLGVYADPLVESGHLCRLLPAWTGPRLEICVTLPLRRARVPVVRAFLEALESQAIAFGGSEADGTEVGA